MLEAVYDSVSLLPFLRGTWGVAKRSACGPMHRQVQTKESSHALCVHPRPGSLGKKMSPLKGTLGKIEQVTPELSRVYLSRAFEKVLYELALLSQGIGRL